MMRPSRTRPDARRARRTSPGFTLVELLMVVTIVVILSVATISAVLPAFNARRVSEGSRILQAALSRARDAAVRSNRPHGIRLLPDAANPSLPGVLTSSRFIEIEPGNDYDDGMLVQSPVFTGQPAGFDEPSAYLSYATGPPPQDYRPPLALIGYGLTYGLPGIPTAVYPYLVLREDRYTTLTIPGSPPSLAYIPNPPTNWFFNIKQGEKLQINNSGRNYTVAGPIVDPSISVTAGSSIGTPNSPAANPERLINFGQGYLVTPNLTAVPPNFSFLFLVNGHDDDGDGYVDEGFDGIDNDGDGIIDPGFNGIDDNHDGHIDEPIELYLHDTGGGSFIYPGNPLGYATGSDSQGNPYLPIGAIPPASSFPSEYEQEVFLAASNGSTPTSFTYSVSRRPVPSQGAKETALPTGVVVDMTSWNSLAPPERSVLPVDPATLYVDIMVAPNGQVIAMDANANSAPHVNRPFFHFWLSDVEDVTPPVWGPSSVGAGVDPRYVVPNANPISGLNYVLAMPANTGSDPRGGGSYTYPQAGQVPTTLKGDRRLLSINTRTGALTSTVIESFAVDNTQYPYEAAERGEKDVQP